MVWAGTPSEAQRESLVQACFLTLVASGLELTFSVPYVLFPL